MYEVLSKITPMKSWVTEFEYSHTKLDKSVCLECLNSGTSDNNMFQFTN